MSWEDSSGKCGGDGPDERVGGVGSPCKLRSHVREKRTEVGKQELLIGGGLLRDWSRERLHLGMMQDDPRSCGRI